MRARETAIQRAARNTGLDINLQDVVDSVGDELVVIDSEYRVRVANSAVRSRFQSRFQRGAESPIGRYCYEVLHDRDRPCSTPLVDCPLKEVLQSGGGTTVIHRDRIAVGDRYLKIDAYPLKDSYGNTKAIVELRREVTAERELEMQLFRRHHQLLALSHISCAVSGLWDLDAILEIALDNVLEIINGTIGGILLLDEETETLYYRVQRGLSPKYTREMKMRLGEGISGRVAQTGEPVLLEDISKDLRTAHPDLISSEGLKGFISVPLKAEDKVVGVMNVTSHKEGQFGTDDVLLLSAIGDYLGTAINAARLRERQLALLQLQRALNAQEEERKRIAQELHDETSQAITSLTLNLQAIIGIAEAKGIGDAEFMEKLKTAQSYAIHAGNEIVRLMKELRPTLLDELGLTAAIQRYAKDSLQAQGINVSTEFGDTDEHLGSEVETTLFRIAQGAIGNILKHSEAKNVSIKLECNAKECILHIEDDGKGFDASKFTQVDPSRQGTGLITMKERAALVGGTCHVESKLGQGTKVIVRIPLVRDMADEKDKGANSR